jgi:hypothetical protein
MRVRDHVVIATAAAALSRRRLGRNAVGLWAGAVLIDFDHYLAFCLQEGRVSPAAAVRFYGQPEVPRHWARRAFHAPGAVLAVLALGARLRPLAALGFGMALHVMLDVGHEAGMHRTRAAALDRDRGTCQRCGTHGSDVSTHLTRQPWLLPSYRRGNVVALCRACHVLAHAAQASSP